MDLWVFAYGSLMWRPGFAFAEARRARIDGYHRAFCIRSVHYRGTPSRPGLVLGLDRGGACEGLVFRVAPGDAAAVRAYLRERELIYGVYREVSLAAHLANGESIAAMTFVAERLHPAYVGRLLSSKAAKIVLGASGCAGPNLVYLAQTHAELRRFEIREREIERLWTCAGAFRLDTTEAAAAALRSDRAVALARAWSRHAPKGGGITKAERARFQHRARLEIIQSR